MNEIIANIENKKLSGKISSRNKKQLASLISKFMLLTPCLLIIELHELLTLAIIKSKDTLYCY